MCKLGDLPSLRKAQVAQNQNPGMSPIHTSPSALEVATRTRSVHLDFVPSRDGFSFSNRFEWTPDDLDVLSKQLRPLTAIVTGAGGAAGSLVTTRRSGRVAGLVAGAAIGMSGVADGLVRRIAQRWQTFGLCGGMALTAVERWPQRGSTSTSELKQEPMRALLRRAQERTLRASLPRFAGWWARSQALRRDTGPFASALEAELDRIEAALEAGRPIVLGLIGDAPDPFALHQVVVFGMDRSGPLDSVLEVYDPNAPSRTHTITTSPSSTPRHTSISTSMPTGRRKNGIAHVSTRPNHLHHVFAIEVV